MMTISLRTAKLGKKYSGRDVETDEVQFKSLKIPIEGIELDENELNALLAEPHAHRSLYNTKRDGVIEPYLRCLKDLELKDAWEGAYVRVVHAEGQLEFKKAKLSKIQLQLQTGGLTSLSVEVEGDPKLDKSIAQIIERLGHEVEVEIRADHPSAQDELPLNRHGIGETPEERKSRRGRGLNGNTRRH